MLPKNNRFYLYKRYLQILLPFHFAHHPLCSDYRQEVFHIGSWFICRGCIWTYSSALITLLVTSLIDPFSNFSLFEVFLIVLGVISPAWIGLVHSFHSRMIKDVIRISLGVGWGIALAELWLVKLWIDKIIIFLFIIMFLVVFQRMKRLQSSKNEMKLCKDCSELTENACLDFKKQFEAERLYSREISDLLQQKLNWDDIKNALPQPTSPQSESKNSYLDIE